ncbi:MAG: citrate/2-methylcitrate synthase [Janthinobacterium lividum]
MTQEEATAALGVRRQTLYAYASRGRIQVCADPNNPRRNLYSAVDVAALLRKRDRGRAHDRIAASTMSWGEPIIDTQISTIWRGRLFYRGQDALRLAATATLEQAAMLLWTVKTPPHFPTEPPEVAHPLSKARACASLGIAAAEGHPAQGLSAAAMKTEAAGLVGRLASALVELSDDEAPLHLRLAAAWGCEGQASLLRRALVLLADQELSSSAFAARVAASTGGSMGAAALSGLATLSGPLHGDAPVQVGALLANVRLGGAEPTVRRWLADGVKLPGFGHDLYPEGDPRAAELLSAFESSAAVQALIETVGRLTGLQPTIDVALASLAEQCRLPEGGTFALFAIGRSVGWMAHAIEQVTTGSLLRPRARYCGPEIVEG